MFPSGLGHLAVQYSHAMGYRTIAISGSDSKRQLAKELGADEYINAGAGEVAKALHALGGVKILVLTAPDASVINTLLPTLQVNGTLLLLALMLLATAACFDLHKTDAIVQLPDEAELEYVDCLRQIARVHVQRGS